jgi:hypothetical protein
LLTFSKKDVSNNSASLHLQLATNARGEGFANSISPENWRIAINERQLAYEELEKIDFSKVQPVSAYTLAIGPDIDFSSSTASLDQMLLDYTAISSKPATGSTMEKICYPSI